MQLSTVLPEGMVFPYDFGFSPTTEFCFAVRGKGHAKAAELTKQPCPAAMSRGREDLAESGAKGWW